MINGGEKGFDVQLEKALVAVPVLQHPVHHDIGQRTAGFPGKGLLQVFGDERNNNPVSDGGNADLPGELVWPLGYQVQMVAGK
ncbi:MAG: hypothetical protein VZR11_12760 [Succinimonas sp.]|nr:hypothetical protein [Succinimonas sp.]